MRVLFLHGLGVKPAGIKPSYLREQGCHVVEPALPHGDFEEAVRLAQRAFDGDLYDVLVGDCRGGSVALSLRSGAVPLVLIAPAWKKWGRVNVTKPNTLILHCPHDRVIPFEASGELLRRSELPESALWIVGRDHFMDTAAALDALRRAVLQSASSLVDLRAQPASTKPSAQDTSGYAVASSAEADTRARPTSPALLQVACAPRLGAAFRSHLPTRPKQVLADKRGALDRRAARARPLRTTSRRAPP